MFERRGRERGGGEGERGLFFPFIPKYLEHIQRNGCAALYENDDDFSLLMRMIRC